MPAKSKQNIRGSRAKLSLLTRSKNVQTRNGKNGSVSKETIASQSQVRIKNSSVFRRHACRAHIRQALNHRKMKSEQKSKISYRNKRMELFMISQQYKRKMSDALQVSQQEYIKHRKISWGEESEYVSFDRSETCESIRSAQRHKFSIDESE